MGDVLTVGPRGTRSRGMGMPSFAGVNHVALSVTDLDVSDRFSTDVLGFRRVLDIRLRC